MLKFLKAGKCSICQTNTVGHYAHYVPWELCATCAKELRSMYGDWLPNKQEAEILKSLKVKH